MSLAADAEGIMQARTFRPRPGRKSAELARERYKLRSQRREQTLKVVSQAARGDSFAFDPIVFDVDCIVLTNAEALCPCTSSADPADMENGTRYEQVDHR
jgi:hypothetical protein